MKELLRTVMIIMLPYYGAYNNFKKSKQHGSYFQFVRFKTGLVKRYWPAHKNCIIANPSNIRVGINCLIGRPGNYLQGMGGIEFGNYVQLAQNVGVLSANHDLYDQQSYNPKKVVIGDYSWVGMNSVILPGVKLGPRTIVAAGSVVTKSFPEGFCIVGGNPAKVIKLLDREKIAFPVTEHAYYGFVPAEKFERKYLKKSR